MTTPSIQLQIQNICEHVVKDTCDCQNVSVKLPYVYVWFSPENIFIFLERVFSFFSTSFCFFLFNVIKPFQVFVSSNHLKQRWWCPQSNSPDRIEYKYNVEMFRHIGSLCRSTDENLQESECVRRMWLTGYGQKISQWLYRCDWRLMSSPTLIIRSQIQHSRILNIVSYWTGCLFYLP